MTNRNSEIIPVPAKYPAILPEYTRKGAVSNHLRKVLHNANYRKQLLIQPSVDRVKGLSGWGNPGFMKNRYNL